MSELFSLFKKTEAQKRSVNPLRGPGTAGLEKEVLDTGSEVAVTSAPTLIPSQSKFDLELADSRIKAVLDSRTLPGEQFRFLRARLGQLQRQHGIKKLLITSSLPGEGKTFTACCLAGILAQEPGKRVLLIDADLRKPCAAQNLGLYEREQPGGLSRILAGSMSLEEALLSSSTMDFFFLPAGPEAANPSELLASNNLERVIQQVNQLFDWVVVDSPPVLTLADPSRLAPLCDAVLMVVQANKTPSKLILKAVQMVGRDLVCGVVMNRVLNLQSSRYYRHYYKGDGLRKK